MSAIAAVAVIYYNGKHARVRALIDLIVQQKMDEGLIEATRRVHALRDGGNSLSTHADKDSQERKDILRVLNNQEFIAVGVRLKAFDEEVYKQMQCTNVLRMWNVTRGFIHEIRRADGKETIFQDFEKLACKWQKDPIKKID